MLIAFEKRSKAVPLNEKGQQLTQSASLRGKEVLERSNLKVVDLNVLSESDIRSIWLSEDKQVLVLVTLEGGAQAWCNYHELRTKKQAFGDELPEVLEEAAQNMQNNNVGK